MPRTRGSFNNPNSFEVAVSAPLDARQRVDLDADLINPSTWITGGMDYSFEGMLAYSEESKSFWILTALPATVKSNWKQVGSGSSGDPTEVYKTTATLSTAIGGSTTIGAASVGKQISDIFVDRTLIYDKDGTVGVASSITGNDFAVTTITVSPGLRQGVRLGAVNTETDLPASVADATALGFPTPVEGDYVNVRKDSTHGDKLAEYLVQTIDADGKITWFFDHVLNDSDYQEQSKTVDAGKILVGGAQQGTFGVSIDPTTFIKGVQFNGTDLTQDTDGKVNVQAVGSISIAGSPQLPDAQGNVNLPDYVKTISVDGNNVPKDSNGNVEIPSDIKTISVGGVNIPKDLNNNVDLPEGGGVIYVVRIDGGNVTVKPEDKISILKSDVTAVFKGYDPIQLTDFLKDITTKDLVIIHGTDSDGATDEFSALYVDDDNDNIEFYVLTDNKAGSAGGASDGTYTTSEILDTTIRNQTTIPYNTVVGHRSISDVVVGETLIYDPMGTVGVVTAIAGTNLVVRTITTSGSGGSLSEDITSNVEVGAAPANTKFDEGLSFTEFAKKILIKEIAPTVTFSATNSGVKEVGTSQSCTMTLNVTAMGTALALTEVEFYVGSNLVQTVAYSGSNTFTYAYGTPITTNTTVKAVLRYRKSDTSSATIEKTASYKFVKASYYGIVAPTGDVTADMVKGLTKDIREAKGKTVTGITTNFQRIVFAYPASFGNLTSIKDGNGFSNFDSYSKSTLSIDGENYNLYVLITPMTTTNATQIYA